MYKMYAKCNFFQKKFIFKFVRCLEVYKKKLINLDLGGTKEGLLAARVPKNQPRRVNLRVHLGVHEGP